MIVRRPAAIACAAMLALLAGCASRTTRVAAPAAVLRPALTASREQLIQRYEEQAGAVNSINAAVRLKAETGSAFTGVIKSYRQIEGFILAERENRIRVVGQAPVVGTDIFDMVSDGNTFHMYIPSKKQFLVGPSTGGEAAKSSIENLRPQPLYEALIWPKVPPDAPVLIEEESTTQPPVRSYVLTVLRRADGQLEIDRRIWFDRSDLHVSRVEIFGAAGRIDSDIRYGDWREQAGNPAFPWQIVLRRPHEDYDLEIDVTRATLNPSISADRFRLEQPAGTKLVEVGKGGGAE